MAEKRERAYRIWCVAGLKGDGMSANFRGCKKASSGRWSRWGALLAVSASVVVVLALAIPSSASAKSEAFTPQRITTNAVQASHQKVSGDRIVWQASDGSHLQIYPWTPTGGAVKRRSWCAFLEVTYLLWKRGNGRPGPRLCLVPATPPIKPDRPSSRRSTSRPIAYSGRKNRAGENQKAASCRYLELAAQVHTGVAGSSE
jgi:hypothetical protein